MLRVSGWAFIFWLFLPLPSWGWEAQAKAICEPMGVPFRLVRAVVQVESSGNPYALNVRMGKVWESYRLTSYPAAKAILEAALEHTLWIDVGLMQIHLATWAHALAIDPVRLLDVSENLRAGCMILAQALSGDGPLWQRIGRYHSRTPARNEAYALKVLHVATQD